MAGNGTERNRTGGTTGATLPELTTGIKWAYAVGQLGWSILSGLIQVWLVWFYNPPSNVDIPQAIPRGAVLGFLTVIGLITMSGRFFDAVTDPWLANMSDASRNPKGRRIPFMAKAALPFVAMTILVYWSPGAYSQALNIVWLTVTLLAHYFFFTMYVAPYFALISELGRTSQDRIDLSTYTALTWFAGYIVASAAAFIWPVFEGMGMPLVSAIRLTVVLLALLGMIFLLVPVLTIRETKWVAPAPAAEPVHFIKAIGSVFQNRNFLLFEVFFLAYGIAITIFQTGNVYYATVLLGMDETAVTLITAATGMLAFLLYPLVNRLSLRLGKKRLCLFAMALLIFAYVYCAFLGVMPLPAIVQVVVFVLLAGIGFAIFGILPNAICADTARNDALRTGKSREGMFFAVQTFMSKMGQMVAMVLFSSILLLGKEPGHDIGIRLTGAAAAVIGVVALAIFSRYREEPDLSEEASVVLDTAAE